MTAVSHMAPEEEPDEYDETYWTDLVTADFSASIKSKTLAERAAWNFLETCKTENKYCPEIATICPSVILGEIISTGDNTSNALIKEMMLGVHSQLLTLAFNMVDV